MHLSPSKVLKENQSFQVDQSQPMPDTDTTNFSNQHVKCFYTAFLTSEYILSLQCWV
jgi:hypothetical protein